MSFNDTGNELKLTKMKRILKHRESDDNVIWLYLLNISKGTWID